MQDMAQITNKNGEVKHTSFSTISRKDVSVQSVGSKEVEVYDFVSTYEPGPSGSKEDYRVIKKPKLVEKYDIRKVIQERCKGQDLKSIVARIEKTGDVSILQQKQVAYGDGRVVPHNLGDALQKGVDGAKFLDKLSASDKEKLIKMAKNPEEFNKFIADEEAKITKSKEKASAVQEKVEVKAEDKGDK